MSFEQTAAEGLDKYVALLTHSTSEKGALTKADRKYDVVALLTNVAKSAVKEKVTRVVVATLRVSIDDIPHTITRPAVLTWQNLLTIAPAQNLPSMFTTKLLPFVVSLQSRKWSDEEIVEDVEYLKDELTSKLEGLT